MTRSRLAAPALAALMLIGAHQARAESSADQIVNALRPTAGDLTHGPGRGIQALSVADVPVHRVSAGRVAAASPRVDASHGIDLNIQFRSGSAELTPAATSQLDELGAALIRPQLASDSIRIEGHTDTQGDAGTNKELSQQRADAVSTYLQSHFNVPARRLTTAGMGEEGLAFQTPDQTPEPRNRRVRIADLSS